EGDEVRLRHNFLDLWEYNFSSLESSEAAQNIRALHDSGVTVHHDPITVKVIFPDENLDAVMRAVLGKQPDEEITAAELAKIKWLDAANKGIADLTGIEYCTNLEALYLNDNRISDLSPLSSLTNLIEIRLWSNEISDISALSSLTSLSWLYLSDNRITDVSALTSLTNLIWLILKGNQISDISPLLENGGLGEGDEIWLEGNPLDLENVEGLLKSVQALESRGVVVHGVPH
ncbi:MAG: leucine-rich repeat domain-containing protein, partial [Dehalococcoidia bacterium]